MSEYAAPTEPVVPEGADVTDDLTVDELSKISQALRCDVGSALADTGTGAGRRWDAMALLAWAWAKRTDQRAKVTPFRQLTANQLLTILRMDDDEDQAPEDAGELAELDPTDPTPES